MVVDLCVVVRGFVCVTIVTEFKASIVEADIFVVLGAVVVVVTVVLRIGFFVVNGINGIDVVNVVSKTKQNKKTKHGMVHSFKCLNKKSYIF